MISPILYTNRCTLSQITDDDTSDLWDIFKDTSFIRFLPELAQEFNSSESLKTFIKTFNTYQAEDTGLIWGVKLKNSLIGFVGIIDIPYSATLFYAMHPYYRNRGFMSDAIDEVISYWTHNFSNIQLCTEVYRENQASLNILQHHKNIKVILK